MDYNNKRILILIICGGIKMKKIIALLLSVLMICCLSVTAFAAESPTATEKVVITFRKSTATAPVQSADVQYTVDKGYEITVKADAKYGTFTDWSIYRADATAATADDYEIVSGSLTTSEMTVKVNATLIICANYDNVKTNPLEAGSTDKSDAAPKTADVTGVYFAVIMLSVMALGFSAKKVYSK